MSDLERFDTDLFLWINQHHNTVSDWTLWVASQGWSWAIMLVAAFCVTTLRREPRRWWLVLAGIGLCFLLADRISVLCFKDVFCRLRPCQVLDNVRMFRTSCGGLYGFVSSHAANVFALSVFLSMRFRNKDKHSWVFTTLMMVWATVVCYSRPYLGKHFPGDVVCGAVLGVCIGMTVYCLAQYVEKTLEMRIKLKK